MEFFKTTKDEVIGGYVVAACVDYKYALDNLLPLINRLDIQRDPLKTKFYARLEADINRGCVMPPITVALISDNGALNREDEIKDFIINNLDNAFILDGIQRLNTLNRASKSDEFKNDAILYVNFVIASSRDKLLYRMITLNNGQKPMSARHQIDVLSETFFDFSDLDLQLISEKSKGRVRAPDTFKKADFVKGYIAYLSDSVNIDNQKIIEEKMDELIAKNIIESDISIRDTEFVDVIAFVNEISKNEYLRNWIRNQNNFIGLCVGIKNSYKFIISLENNAISDSIKNFEKAFSAINVSKVNVAKVRREIVSRYIKDFDNNFELTEYDLLDKISGWIF
jgi:hypothetical protein